DRFEDVAPLDVLDLVREHAGDLLRRLGLLDEALIQHDSSTERGVGVDLGRAYGFDENREAGIAGLDGIDARDELSERRRSIAADLRFRFKPPALSTNVSRS